MKGMHFRAFHGCLESERREGNDFYVDFACEYDTSKAEKSDCLEDTLNYAEIYDIVAAEMAAASNLLEHVAGRIADGIMAAHPEIPSLEIKVTKMRPPVEGTVENSSVTVKR